MRPKVQYMRLAISFALLALAFACGSTERVEDSPTPPAQAQAPAPQVQTPTPPAPTAQPRPAPDRAATVEPSGTLTIAVAAVGSPSGLPRFCAAGCSENIYMSGATETLFGSKASEGGAVIADPMLALDFVLSPTLEFGDFTLRQGVQFHHAFGEMSADDVAFSYNDANSVTNPESIHGQAGDFAPLIESIEAIEPHKVRLNYRSYDSRGVLHRFSMFWQTAGIVSKSVYDVKGADAMRNDYTGVGPFVIDRWTPGDGIFMTAFTDYYGAPLGLGPHVERVEWRVAGESVARRAMLESGPAQIAQAAASDYADLEAGGFELQKGGLFDTINNISFVGNYWESHSGLTGEALDRERDISRPWIGNPFENGPDYDETTDSMERSRKVREALAWSIERQSLVDDLMGGLGVVNHQPYLSTRNPHYMQEWSWGTDFDRARELMAEAGYEDGFGMALWVGGELDAAVGAKIGADWKERLGVDVSLIRTSYLEYRPGLVARTNKMAGLGICGDENKSNFPYDWARGFVVSSFSAGGYGVGQEIPYATEVYSQMAGEPDKARREELAARFYTENRKWANCVGLYEQPIWPVYDPSRIAKWDMRPMANGNLGTINNVRSIELK